MAVISCSLMRMADKASSTLSSLQSFLSIHIGPVTKDNRLEGGDCIKDSIVVIVWKARRSLALAEALAWEDSAGGISDVSMACIFLKVRLSRSMAEFYRYNYKYRDEED